ncbi:DUF6924 domain-containing protein [Streptomyces canus]|uniref:DUF6924 domain-containing protein n=1 Tax=Streptomyces canus TaxID=58343 RepID=UPI0038635BA7
MCRAEVGAGRVQCCDRVGSPGWRYCPRMNQLPCTVEALVVRTDFSADGAWDAVREALFSPGKEGFLSNVAPRR